MRGKAGGDATPKRNHANFPLAPPSDGERAVGALGSSRHTWSSGMLRACMSDSTPCSWHSALAREAEVASGDEGDAPVEGEGEGGGEGSGASKAAEREALAARERCVKAMDASGPASVRMC